MKCWSSGKEKVTLNRNRRREDAGKKNGSVRGNQPEILLQGQDPLLDAAVISAAGVCKSAECAARTVTVHIQELLRRRSRLPLIQKACFFLPFLVLMFLKMLQMKMMHVELLLEWTWMLVTTEVVLLLLSRGGDEQPPPC